ncbi:MULTISPECIES: hypothetical protein [unclassified Paraburkholderia]|uniref:hypothetical protein n=1 Tax=unclassified Paraburkholderia TaxID=2615204 RepID=UPI00182C19AD|nr:MULTISPECIES: hypothetical protein [unclassified Paraburkholderia]MBB5445008.1 hypothetical protein [Paraburkholderia sp. WSM4177]MBB5483939.1 hypothetical protein [Paraburkholderia sp. WSM4180]
MLRLEPSKSLARPEVGSRLVKQSADYARAVEQIVGLQAEGLRSQAIQTLNKDLLPIYVGYTAILEDINQLSLILVEQNARKALGITHNAVVLERGSVVHSSTAAELLAQDHKIDTLLAVSRH